MTMKKRTFIRARNFKRFKNEDYFTRKLFAYDFDTQGKAYRLLDDLEDVFMEFTARTEDQLEEETYA